MSKNDNRKWDDNFIKYTEFIVSHPNYKGLCYERGSNGLVKWVVTGKSKEGKERREWWNKQCHKKGISINPGCYANIARIIHPTKLHICQMCGRAMSIFYVYPTKRLLKQINKICKKFNLEEFRSADKDIFEILELLLSVSDKIFEEIRLLFGIPQTIANKTEKFSEYVKINYVNKCSKLLSPGVMSNSPDRYDGFHSDGLCHRSETDKGRHDENMRRYSQDRRAYENWAEGDWNLTNRIMGEFKRFSKKLSCPLCHKMAKMTADHVGPISLGFTHRPGFNPLCISCNSKKNNRMLLEDVKNLIRDENSHEEVISWHTKYVWDALKRKISTNAEALLLSKVMRKHLHNVLTMLSVINDAGYRDFLKGYLNPEFSFFDFKFNNFHPMKLGQLEILKKPLVSANKKKNAERYIRISFEALNDYKLKKNRRVKKWTEKGIDANLELLFKYLDNDEAEKAHEQMEKTIRKLSDLAIADFSKQR